jgi:hypothetical protein
MGYFMDWLRLHRRRLLRLTLGVWLLAVVAFQGCLTQADHHPNAAHPAFSSQSLTAEHIQHAGGCLMYCADSAQGISAAIHILSFDLAGMAIWLLLPALILFDSAEKSPLPRSHSGATQHQGLLPASCPHPLRSLQRVNQIRGRPDYGPLGLSRLFGAIQ